MNKPFIAAILALVLTTLSCSIFVGGPAYPPTPAASPTPAPQSLSDEIQQALAAGAGTGTVTLTITQEQLTTYLASQLQAQSQPIITDPQVVLSNGQMQVFGKVQQGVFTANASLTMTVSVDQNGLPKLTITQQDFGPFPAPQDLNDSINALVAEAFTGSLGPAATGFRLETISIGDGVMTITGRTQ
jgi:hypothetical protein